MLMFANLKYRKTCNLQLIDNHNYKPSYGTCLIQVSSHHHELGEETKSHHRQQRQTLSNSRHSSRSGITPLYRSGRVMTVLQAPLLGHLILRETSLLQLRRYNDRVFAHPLPPSPLLTAKSCKAVLNYLSMTCGYA